MQMIHWVFFMKITQKEEESERGVTVSPENRFSYSCKI